MADPTASAPLRLASLEGLLALGQRPDRWWFQRDWTGTDQPLHEHIRVSFSKLDRLENALRQSAPGPDARGRLTGRLEALLWRLGDGAAADLDQTLDDDVLKSASDEELFELIDRDVS